MNVEQWEFKSNNIKWADFLIIAVKKDITGRITHVRVGVDFEDKIRKIIDVNKYEIMDVILNKNTVFTAYQSQSIKFIKGSPVKIYQIDNDYYLRTLSNNISKDNLDNLPTF